VLIDRATIFVRSGKGGHGCVSFRREKFVPKGGPDGGDGGQGGDVILRGDAAETTLLPLTPRPHYRATNGQPGMGKSMTGADGKDCIVAVPLGTLVFDKDSGEQLADITRDGQSFVAAKGGRGGYGNEHFKSATNQTPREATPGDEWEERTLLLELKLIADVGLIGLPNAGKSTMLRAISRATPKVAEYPFTTLAPHLGIADLPGREPRRLIVADIPGLIEGAADGAGLGHDFLRHVERTRVLVHVVDVMPLDGSDPVDNYRLIRDELFAYSPMLAEKEEIIALNKTDLIPASETDRLTDLVAQLGLDAEDVVVHTSGATSRGMDAMLEACWSALRDSPVSDWRND
jgi:GTP-binding protein